MDRAARRRAARGNGPKIAGMWLSNAPFTPTGYGTQTAQAVQRIAEDGHAMAIAVNYGLEAVSSEWEGIELWPKGFDPYSQDMCAPYYRDWARRHPSHVPWMFTLYDVWTLTNANWDKMNVASWVPVDHLPVPPPVAAFCEKSNVTPIAMSRFGQEQLARRDIEAMCVPHAIETSVFKPTASVGQDDGRRLTGRDIMGFGEDEFVVLIANANKGVPSRKAFAEQILAFSIFAAKHDDARLFIHSEQFGAMSGIAFDPLLQACGLRPHQVKFINQYQLRMGIPSEVLAALYSSADVFLNPTYGEGFGITQIEAQACGLRVITQDFSAQAELAGPDSIKVTGQPFWDATQLAWFSVPSVPETVKALEAMYSAGRVRSEAAIAWTRENYDADVVFERDWRPTLERLVEIGSASAVVEPVESSWDNGKPAGSVLTIYIPTKNRPELAALLDSLAPQLDERVEVVVSDNAGTASNLVRDLLGESCRVEYSRRSYDIGGDANILRGFTAGTAPWLWILGDDDTVTDTAIQTVLSHIGWTTSDRLILMSNSTPRGACGAIGSLAQIAERDPALPIAATLISANVVRRSACDPAAGFSRVDTKYGHAYAFPGLVHVVADPILARVGRLHAGEGVPDGWDGQAVKADYLRSVGIEPTAENFSWNYMSAEASNGDHQRVLLAG